jgi:hypothetical protein
MASKTGCDIQGGDWTHECQEPDLGKAEMHRSGCASVMKSLIWISFQPSIDRANLPLLNTFYASILHS